MFIYWKTGQYLLFLKQASVYFLQQDGAVQPEISIKNLNKSYDSGFQALKDINLDISLSLIHI